MRKIRRRKLKKKKRRRRCCERRYTYYRWGMRRKFIALQVQKLSLVISYICQLYGRRTQSLSANKFIFHYSNITFMLHVPKFRIPFRYKILHEEAKTATVFLFHLIFQISIRVSSSQFMSCVMCPNVFITTLHIHEGFDLWHYCHC
jgi:hypothetical protein